MFEFEDKNKIYNSSDNIFSNYVCNLFLYKNLEFNRESLIEMLRSNTNFAKIYPKEFNLDYKYTYSSINGSLDKKASNNYYISNSYITSDKNYKNFINSINDILKDLVDGLDFDKKYNVPLSICKFVAEYPNLSTKTFSDRFKPKENFLDVVLIAIAQTTQHKITFSFNFLNSALYFSKINQSIFDMISIERLNLDSSFISKKLERPLLINNNFYTKRIDKFTQIYIVAYLIKNFIDYDKKDFEDNIFYIVNPEVITSFELSNKTFELLKSVFINEMDSYNENVLFDIIDDISMYCYINYKKSTNIHNDFTKLILNPNLKNLKLLNFYKIAKPHSLLKLIDMIIKTETTINDDMLTSIKALCNNIQRASYKNSNPSKFLESITSNISLSKSNEQLMSNLMQILYKNTNYKVNNEAMKFIDSVMKNEIKLEIVKQLLQTYIFINLTERKNEEN